MVILELIHAVQARLFGRVVFIRYEANIPQGLLW